MDLLPAKELGETLSGAPAAAMIQPLPQVSAQHGHQIPHKQRQLDHHALRFREVPRPVFPDDVAPVANPAPDPLAHGLIKPDEGALRLVVSPAPELHPLRQALLSGGTGLLSLILPDRRFLGGRCSRTGLVLLFQGLGLLPCGALLGGDDPLDGQAHRVAQAGARTALCLPGVPGQAFAAPAGGSARIVTSFQIFVHTVSFEGSKEK